MRIILFLFAAVLGLGCQNTNPDQGSGGVSVDKKTTLSNVGIIDSTKSILKQSFELRRKRIDGKITSSQYEKQNTELMTTYNTLYYSLPPADTIIIHRYRLDMEKENSEDSLKNTSN